MKIKDLLKKKGKEVFTINSDSSLFDCIQLMNKKRIGALVVVDDIEKVVGLVSERDILQAIYNQKSFKTDSTVKEIMTPMAKLITVSAETDVKDVMDLMTNHKIRHLPVMMGKSLEGMVSIGDVVKALLDTARIENEDLQNYIYGN